MALTERILAPIAHIRGRLRPQRMEMAHDGVMQPLTASKPAPHIFSTSLKNNLSIPCPDPTAEERARDMHQMRGQKLARLEDWETLTSEILKNDAERTKTPGGMPVAEVLAFGARNDVVSFCIGAGCDTLDPDSSWRGTPALDGQRAATDGVARIDCIVSGLLANP